MTLAEWFLLAFVVLLVAGMIWTWPGSETPRRPKAKVYRIR